MIDFEHYLFHPVINLPSDYEVYDFSQNYDPNRKLLSPFGIGKYNEKRKNMYTSALFDGERNIHMGIDIGAPVGTPVHAFHEGEIYLFANNAKVGDYGYTLITKHQLSNQFLYALFGHLSAISISDKKVGQKIKRGEIIAWVGNKNENGGWNPHLHFQLSYEEPKVCDMPGVVNEANREKSLAIYPDPRKILGKLY